WAELMKAGFGLVSTSWQASEMLVASGSVIGARMTIMSDAARRPLDADYAEIGGMVSEKVVAASKVNQALVDQWSAMLLDASEQVQHVGRSVLAGHPLGAGDLWQLTERSLAHSTRMMARTMETGGLALAPVHQQATANARRLG
ncbi:MAG TPA: hypothetical protein VM899_03180, partial [Rubellimicrobium sp.]|nr:hypothetical protein [Rubellimicrobium sp.]